MVTILDASVSENIAKAMSSTSLWTAIAKTIIIILLGFFLTKWKIFPEGTGKVLTKVVMNVALPCLAFTSFMTTFTTSGGVDALFNFIFGFIIYILFIFLGNSFSFGSKTRPREWS
jgi:predicted permease